MGRYVVGVSGASGVILAKKTVQALVQAGHYVDLVMSSYALYTISLEMGKQFATPSRFIDSIEEKELISCHPIQDVGASIASGSYLTDGMIVIPCSMTTVAAISAGLGDNALRRAADVTLKERRPLILVPRETPFSTLHLENLHKLSQYGATIIPPIPAWYIEPKTVGDIEDFLVGKVLDVLKIEHALYTRWEKSSKASITEKSSARGLVDSSFSLSSS